MVVVAAVVAVVAVVVVAAVVVAVVAVVELSLGGASIVQFPGSVTVLGGPAASAVSGVSPRGFSRLGLLLICLGIRFASLCVCVAK